MIIITSVLNRLRGGRTGLTELFKVPEDSLFYKHFNGAILYALLFGLMFWFVTGAWWATIVGVGLFTLGERSGWGKWIRQLLRVDGPNPDSDRGKSYPWIHYIANFFVKEEVNYLWYARVALFFRGLYWWLPSMIFLVCMGLPLWVLFLAVFLGVAFPVAVELTRYVNLLFTSDWGEQEYFYGAFQGLAWLAILLV